MKRRERPNGLNALLALVAVSVLFLYLFAQQVTRNALFVPGPPSYGLDESISQVTFDGGASLAVFWAPSPGASKTLFYLHGNGEDLGDTLFILTSYRLQGVNVLSFDYRGYGLSEGEPSERNTYKDAEAVLEHAETVWGVDPRQVVVHGRSLGGGVGMELALRQPVAGLILESSFLSAFRVYLPFKHLPGDKYRNFKKAPKLACPTLLIHGKRDEVVPFWQAEELASLVPNGLARTLWVEGAGHNDLPAAANERYWAALRRFVADL